MNTININDCWRRRNGTCYWCWWRWFSSEKTKIENWLICWFPTDCCVIEYGNLPEQDFGFDWSVSFLFFFHFSSSHWFFVWLRMGFWFSWSKGTPILRIRICSLHISSDPTKRKESFSTLNRWINTEWNDHGTFLFSISEVCLESCLFIRVRPALTKFETDKKSNSLVPSRWIIMWVSASFFRPHWDDSTDPTLPFQLYLSRK